MTFTPRQRKVALTMHVAASVGWLGAVAAFLTLAIANFTSGDAQRVRAAYLAMELIGWTVIVPLSFGSLLTGLAQASGTGWGLFRHYWVLIKLLLTPFATTVLVVHMRTTSQLAEMAMTTNLSHAEFDALRTQPIIAAAGAIVVLLTAVTLAVNKPQGLTPYGARKLHARRAPKGSPSTAQKVI